MGIQGNIHKRWEYRAIFIKDGNTAQYLEKMGIQGNIYKRWEYRAIFIKDGNTGQYLWKMGLQCNIYKRLEFRAIAINLYFLPERKELNTCRKLNFSPYQRITTSGLK